ncbi:sigma-54-dependent Fis family transcriptional regulator [Halotalea alkalilenta]|uniref:Sigma-54-dependent Fis family transcriptional regulator n=1 Tax=Halotalea alkalilenta TaxID=376489 RepID=A0A172YI42_9GAMM|nr:sigma-54-dependent Fis family transcriptional regulator [Halotalea alkalilenta]ANF58879.1 sigma-54-dependent Fis family transcriptional regulator [Halotalea alkalilenta]
MHDSTPHHARQVWEVGQDPHALLASSTDPAIAHSWHRCLAEHRLDPSRPLPPQVLEYHQLRSRRQHLEPLLELSRHAVAGLERTLGERGQAILITDADGVILESAVHDGDRDDFIAAGLCEGADWSEGWEGTNGIGTCVVERQALTIHRDEHFRVRHTVLSCSAAPIFAPDHALLAVLDVSSVRGDVHRHGQFHVTAQVAFAARALEHGYFLRQYEAHTVLRFRTVPGLLGMYCEGLIALDGAGRVLAINRTACELLHRSRERLLGASVTAIFSFGAGAQDELESGQELLIHDLDGRAFKLIRARGARARIERRPPRTARLPVAPESLEAPAVPGLYWRDPSLLAELSRARRVYEHDIPLLLQGETGTGKEAFARTLHQSASRADAPFIALNCAAIPEALIESELFGYRGGSFTGARREGMRGKLLEANGGTLFLDEIGDMPLGLQTRLLRVLEERQVTPLGGEPCALDVRIVAASLHDLGERVATGAFREDLFYRLSGLSIRLPPLRERADREALIDGLLAEFAAGRPLELDTEARRALLCHPWPGNVRQLRNQLRTLAALDDDGVISFDELPLELRERGRRAAPAPVQEEGVLENAERRTLLELLEQSHWQVSRVAERIGVSRNTLYRKLRKHGIQRPA